MDAACRRLCLGDTSSLPDIVDCIEAGQQAPTGKLGIRAYTALGTLLFREGLVLRESHASDSVLPSAGAFYALRILAVLGMRHAEEGYNVKSVLLSLGLQRCRGMILDAYFALKRWQRYYVVMFVTLLIGVYGCRPQDLLQSATSLNILAGSTDPGWVSPCPEGTAESTEVVPALPHHTAQVATASAGCSGSPASLTGPTNPQPPVATGGSPSPRRMSIQNHRPVRVSIPGTSTDLPVQPARWYRELPRSPINAPYSVNPLYVSEPLRESSGSTTAAGGRTGDDGADNRASPASQMLVAETAMTAQFPTPVVLFSAYHGVGCVPCLPTIDDLARLDAWRERKQQEHALKSPATASSSLTRIAERRHGWGFILEAALQMRDPDAAGDEGLSPPFVVRNEMAFVLPNPEAVAYHCQCLNSSLLRQYLEQGELLSWGSLAKGALGQHSQRRGRSTPGMPESDAISSDPAESKAKLSGGAPVTMGTPQQYSSAPGAAGLGGKEEQTSLAEGNLPTADPPMAATKALLARGPFATDVQPETRPTRGSVADQFQASPCGELKATSITSAESLAGSTASPHDTSVTGYVYLPLSVHTPARVAQIACGLAVTYVVTVDGVLYSCGRADNGQLGIGGRSMRYAHAGVSKLQRVLFKDNERVTRIAAGTACAVALTRDNALYCWGHNVYGQCLKMPDASRVLTPVRLKAGVHKVLDVCFGQFFGVLLFDDGVMGTWGIASMLGCNMSDKELEHSLAPDQCKCARQVVHLRVGTSNPMAAVRAGPWHALAISQKGEVYTWGVGSNGRLGHGTDSSEVKPRLVEGLRSSFVVDASCSHVHSAVLTSTGAVYVFGGNAEGQLGLRGLAPRRLPTMVPLPIKAVAVMCAREHTCILLADGDVVACGSYRMCGIGLGYGRRFCAPMRILTNYVTMVLHSSYLQGMAGVVHRRTAVMVLGHSTIEEVSRVPSLSVRNGVRCAASGAGFLVVLWENNSLVAIGRGERGQLGIGDCMKSYRSDDVTVASAFSEVHIPSDVIIQHVRCGPDFALALDECGVVYGWGSNDHQKLCQPAGVAHIFTPVRVDAYASERIVQIVCGGTFVVALTVDGEVLAHGEAMYCGLGVSTSPAKAKGSDVSVPIRVAGLRDIVAVAAGCRHAVAMTASCSVFAWGVGVFGTGSNADTTDPASSASVVLTPVRVALSQTIRSIGCGPHNSFAINDEGELWVWGMNKFGECGIPTSGDSISTSSGGGALQDLAAGQKQGSDAAVGHANVITAPTPVARHVRDAAFTDQFGVVVFEDGQVSVSGRIRYGGQNYHLPTFHSTPQPPFSIDVNELVRHPPPELRPSLNASKLGGGGGASTAAASAQRQPGCQGSADSNSASEDENEQSESSHVGVPAASKPAKVSTDGQHQRRPQPPSLPRSHVVGMGMVASSPTSALSSKSSPQRANPSLPSVAGGHSSPPAPSSGAVTMAGALAPLAVPRDRLSSFTSPLSGTRDASQLDYRLDMMSEYFLPSLSGLIPSEEGSTHQATTAIKAGTMDTAEAYLYDTGYSSPDARAPLFKTEASREAVVCTPMPSHRVSDGAAPPSVQARTSTAAQARHSVPAAWGTLDVSETLALPLPPDRSTAQGAGAGMAAARAKVRRQPLQMPQPPQSAQREQTARLPAGFKSPKLSLPSPPPSASDERILGIRCFAGWEQICILMEKYRPSAAEVGVAQRSLQVLLRQDRECSTGGVN
ncbi:Regulator of chromosome condensation (RCC1) repeat, putative [Leishmania guyanensis]